MTTKEPKKRGRPPTEIPYTTNGVYLPTSMWEWLDKNQPAGKRSKFIERAVLRAIRREQRKAEQVGEQFTVGQEGVK